MKNYFYLIMISLIVLCLNNSCKKDTVDYRDKYCGEWNFVTKSYYYNTGDYTLDTTFNYQGFVWYDSVGIINIEFRESYVINFKVSLEGEITDYILFDNETVNGGFINQDSLFMDYRQHGGLYGITQFIHGKKIE